MNLLEKGKWGFLNSLLRWRPTMFGTGVGLLRFFWIIFDQYKPWKLRKAFAAKIAAKKVRERPRTIKHAVFVCEKSNIRVAKLAYGLRLLGWQVILLRRVKSDEYEKTYFDKIENFKDPCDALRIAANYTPVVFHVFAGGSYFTPYMLIRYRPGKVVLDAYDYIGVMFNKNLASLNLTMQINMERYCVENADGLCCRGLESQYAKKFLRYRFKGKRILFPDYCWDSMNKTKEILKKNSEIHVVVAGTIAIEKQHKERTFEHYLETAKIITSNGIHFHIYPTRWSWEGDFEEAFSDYFDWAKENHFLKVKRPIPVEDLLVELEKYHFGLLIPKVFISNGQKSLAINLKGTHYTAVGSRVFSYLEAGLISVVPNLRFVRWLCLRYGIGYSFDQTLLESPKKWFAERLPDEKQQKQLLSSRDYLSIPRQIHRLEKFYGEL